LFSVLFDIKVESNTPREVSLFSFYTVTSFHHTSPRRSYWFLTFSLFAFLFTVLSSPQIFPSSLFRCTVFSRKPHSHALHCAYLVVMITEF
jgi:hypothetical protein